MRARRAKLANLGRNATTHAGLWWDKYLPHQNDQNVPDQTLAGVRAEHIKQLERIETPRGYTEALERWKTLLERDPDTVLGEARAQGRLVIGIGDKGALEVGLRLHHTWGVPYLPGSALKGVAAAAAHKLLEDERWRRGEGGGDLHRFLFGTTDEAGAVEFLDALWQPDGGTLPIHLDVMTVHHADYYQTGNSPPSDTDSPNPVSFASISGTYLVGVTARVGRWTPDEREDRDGWVDVALRLLALGLEKLGIGAKTNAGYGRMELEYLSAAEQRPPLPDPPRGPEYARVWLGSKKIGKKRREWIWIEAPDGTAWDGGVKGATKAGWMTEEVLELLRGSSESAPISARVDFNEGGSVSGIEVVET